MASILISTETQKIMTGVRTERLVVWSAHALRIALCSGFVVMVLLAGAALLAQQPEIASDPLF